MLITKALWIEKQMPKNMHELLKNSARNGQGGEMISAVWLGVLTTYLCPRL